MNIDEENKAKEFYIKSAIEGIHIQRTNMVEINYLDMLKLMHSYAQEQVKNLGLFSVSQRSELFFAFLKWAKQADLDYPDKMLLKDFEQFNAKNCG